MKPETTFSTARLRLRMPTAADIDAIFEYASDPEVTAFMDWKCLRDPSEVRDFLATTRDEDADFGYVLHRRAWGRGIATEASRAVVEWGSAA